MKVKIKIIELDAAKDSETILEERIVTTESNKRLTATRARQILKREYSELNPAWHSVGYPILIKSENRWRAMKYSGDNHIWNIYNIEEVLDE